MEAPDHYVVDIRRGYSTKGVDAVGTTWALAWHFAADGKADRVVNLSGDQHEMDAFTWANRWPGFPLPERSADGDTDQTTAHRRRRGNPTQDHS
jgi:hypothetical protein